MQKNQRLLLLSLGVAALIGLFIFIKPKQDTATLPAPTSASNAATASDTNKTVTVTIQNRKRIEGPEIIQVKQGDNVTVVITADEAQEIHLHGYDKSVRLEPGKPVTLAFVADATGHFEYELEDSKTTIGAIEVLPK